MKEEATVPFRFYGLNLLTKLTILGDDPPIDISDLFKERTNLTEITFNTSNAITFESMLDPKNVTDMSEMFANCSNLRKINLTKFNLERVTNMTSMFENCFELQRLVFSGSKREANQINNLIGMSNMFCNCSKLEELHLISFYIVNLQIWKKWSKLRYHLPQIMFAKRPGKFDNSHRLFLR